MKKVLTLLLAVLFVAALFGGCVQKQELRDVTLNEVTRSVFYAPLYVAVTRGYFENEGINLTIVTGGGSDKSMTALLSGDAQVALMGPETGAYVINEGKSEHPIIVAQLTKRDGSFLVGRQAQANFDFESLRGKTIIGGRPGGMPYMTLCYVLRQHGLEPNVDVTVIDNIQFSLMGGAFESGTGDYVTLFEPTASLFEQAGKGYKVANLGLESGEVPYTTFMVQQKTIDEDPAFVEAFVRAIYRAQLWVQTAADSEVAKAMMPFFPDTDQATLELVAKSYRATDSWTQVPTMTEEAFTRLQDVMEGAGVLSARVDFTKLVNNTFGEKAMAEAKK